MYRYNPHSRFARGLAFNYWFDGHTFRDYSAKNLGAATKDNSSGDITAPYGTTIGPVASARFDGTASNDRFDLGSIPSSHPISFFGQGEITIAFWAYYDSSLAGTSFPRIIDKSDGGSGANGWYIETRSTTPRRLELGINSSNVYISSNTALLADAWGLYVITYDQVGDSASFYVNGALDSSSVTGSNNAFPSTTTNAAIGNWNHSTARNWNGQIASVSGWNRILTADEILSLYSREGRFDLIQSPRFKPYLIANVATSGTTINAGVDSLTLTEYNTTVNYARSVSATLDSLTLTEYNASVNFGTGITATLDSLTLTEYAATVDYATSGTNINAGVDNLTLAEYAANINYAQTITAGIDSLTISEYNATISYGTSISAALDALTLTEYAATITGTAYTPPAETADTLIKVGIGRGGRIIHVVGFDQ